MTKATQVSYWIIGLSNKSQSPAVAADVLDAISSVLLSDSHTLTNRETLRADARAWAVQMAQRHGVSAAQVFYDDDSTQCFKND
jgi:hypothetical protein